VKTSIARLWLCAATLAALLAPQSGAFAKDEPSPALQALIKAAQAEGTLNVVWGPSLGAAKGAKALQDGMNKMYGTTITVNYTPGPSFPQMASRVVQEVQAGRPNTTDVVLGAETTIVTLMQGGALQAVDWGKYFSNITPEMKTKNNQAVQVVSLFSGVYYNTRFVKPNEVPHKMADIFKPQWKGKIASTPYAVNFDRLALVFGDAAIRPIVEKTSEWAGGLITCGEYQRLASGEFILMFFDCGRGDERLSVKNGGPMDEVILDDAAITVDWFLGVPKNTAKPNLAKLFVGFMTTPEGQKIIQDYGYTSSAHVPGTAAYEQTKRIEASGAKIVSLSPDEIILRQKELEAFRKEYQQILRVKH